MRILFDCDPMRPRYVDPSCSAEANAAEQCGFSCSLIDFEALADRQDAQRAVKNVELSASGTQVGIYRGWMTTVEQYARLFAALDRLGIRLIQSPAAHLHCRRLAERGELAHDASGR